MEKIYAIIIMFLLIGGTIGILFLEGIGKGQTCKNQLDPYHLFNLNNTAINITSLYNLTEKDLQQGYMAKFDATKCIGSVSKNWYGKETCDGALITPGDYNISCTVMADKQYVCFINHQVCQ